MNWPFELSRVGHFKRGHTLLARNTSWNISSFWLGSRRKKKSNTFDKYMSRFNDQQVININAKQQQHFNILCWISRVQSPMQSISSELKKTGHSSRIIKKSNIRNLQLYVRTTRAFCWCCCCFSTELNFIIIFFSSRFSSRPIISQAPLCTLSFLFF